MSSQIQGRSLALIDLSSDLYIKERIALLLNQTVFVSLLLILPLAAIPYGSVEVWWQTLFQSIIFILGFLWVIEGIFRNRLYVENFQILLPLLALCFLAFIQTLFLGKGTNEQIGLSLNSFSISADSYETRLFLLKFASLTLLLILLWSYVSSHRRLYILTSVIIGVAIVSAMFGILRQTTQVNNSGFILPYLYLNEGYSQFINRNHFAYLMEMALGLVLGLIVGEKRRPETLMMLLSAAAPLWVALILSNSRGGILSMICQIGFVALFLFSTNRNEQEASHKSSINKIWNLGRSIVARSLIVIALLSLTTISVIWIGGDPLASRIEDAAKEASPNSIREGDSRQEIWKATWEMIKDNPIIGVGFSGYWMEISKYHNASGVSTPQQAHNDYLELLASGGLIGLSIFIWFTIMFIKKILKVFNSATTSHRSACIGALIGIATIAIHSLVDFGLHNTSNALIFISLIAIATTNIKSTSDELS
jgi:O-antigen ligase